MRMTTHIALGGVVAAAAYPKFGATWALVFWAATVLIDLDHYMEYLFYNRMDDFSVKKMFLYFDEIGLRCRRPGFLNLSVFHTAEVLIPLCLLAWWSGSAPMQAVVAGFIFHILLDIMYLIHRRGINLRAHSIVEYFIRKRLMERRGLSPATVPIESMAAVFKTVAGTMTSTVTGEVVREDA